MKKSKIMKHFSANAIQKILTDKYKNNGNKYWKWFFSDTRFGDYNLAEIIKFQNDDDLYTPD